MSGPTPDHRMTDTTRKMLAAQPQDGPAAALEPRDAGTAPEPREADSIDRVVRVVLAIGLILSGLLLVAGFVVWAAGGGDLPALVRGPADAARDLVHLEPIGFFSWGLLLLILTPFARVIGTLVAFLQLRDWRFVAVGVGVFATMITAVMIAVL